MKVIYAVFLMLIFSSCISTKQRARNLARSGYDKIQKAIALDPSVADTLFKVVDVQFIVPPNSDSLEMQPVVDTAGFETTLRAYDSLKKVSDSLTRRTGEQFWLNRSNDRYLEHVKRTTDALKAKRSRLLKGFVKDSVYIVEDTLATFRIKFKDGGFQGLTYTIKSVTVKKKVPTTAITLDGRYQPLYKSGWFWGMLALILILILAIIVIARK